MEKTEFEKLKTESKTDYIEHLMNNFGTERNNF